jgi:hypothetical protein
MSEIPPKGQVVIALVMSSVIGLVSFVLIRSAFRPRGSSAGPPSETEQYFAVGTALVIFAVVLYRMCRRSWGHEQVDQLLGFDDTNL